MNVVFNTRRQTIHDGKIFAWIEGGGFSGFVPSPLQPQNVKPYLDWTGGKITMDVWQSILAFFKKFSSDEVQVRLYYNTETKEWKPWAFPQEYPCGMTTKELPDHPHTAVDAAQFGDPWVRLGSVHHHCGAGAFQSGTDTHDESGVPGLHITMGNLRDPKWSIHSRVCIRAPGKLDDVGNLVYGPTQAFFEANLSQWFDLPETWKAILPAAVQSEVTKQLVCMPPDNGTFPERWEANLIRRVTHPNAGGAGGVASGHMGHYPHYLRDHGTAGPGAGGTKTWESISHRKIEIIYGLIEVYNGEDGKQILQTAETNNWKAAGFHSLLAAEGILRSCGFVQVTKFIWCLPQDKQVAERVIEDLQHQHAAKAQEEEARQAMDQAALQGMME